MLSGSTGGRRRGGDAKIIISPNTSFSDLIIRFRRLNLFPLNILLIDSSNGFP